MEIKLKKIIFLEGAQSTGKTYILDRIKENFSGVTTHGEYARKILKEKNISHSDLEKNVNNCFWNLQKDIVLAFYDQILKQNNENFISDRSFFSPLAFSRKYFGEEFANEIKNMSEFEELVKFCRKENPLFFLLTPEEKILRSDNVRKESNLQDLFDLTEIYKTIFEEYGIKYVLIDSFAKRDSLLVEIKNLLY